MGRCLQNEGLVVSTAKIYWDGIYSSGMDKSLTQDDFIQLARIELRKAIDTFNPELVSLEKYADTEDQLT